MITDSYPSGGAKEQRLYLMDMKTEAVLPLGRYHHPDEYRGEKGWTRCDLHPRWSPEGNILGVNSVFKDRKSTSELQSRENLVCRLLLEKKKGPCRTDI